MKKLISWKIFNNFKIFWAQIVPRSSSQLFAVPRSSSSSLRVPCSSSQFLSVPCSSLDFYKQSHSSSQLLAFPLSSKKLLKQCLSFSQFLAVPRSSFQLLKQCLSFSQLLQQSYSASSSLTAPRNSFNSSLPWNIIKQSKTFKNFVVSRSIVLLPYKVANFYVMIMQYKMNSVEKVTLMFIQRHIKPPPIWSFAAIKKIPSAKNFPPRKSCLRIATKKNYARIIIIMLLNIPSFNHVVNFKLFKWAFVQQ